MENRIYTKSQKALLMSARGLFYRYGIKKVSVEDIYKEAGVSKMTFYRSFKDKGDIAYAVMSQILEEGYVASVALHDEDLDFKTYIARVLEMKREYTENISVEFVSDFMATDNAEHLALIMDYNAKVMKIFLEDISRAQARGEVRAELKPEFLMYLIEDLHLKVQDERLLTMFGSAQDMVMELIEHFCLGILSR